MFGTERITQFIFFIAGIAVTAVMFAAPIPEAYAQSSKIKSKECRGLYKKYLGKIGYRSFYLSRDGLSCGTGWGYDTLKDAKKGARDSCRKHSSTCRHLESSGRSHKPTSKACKDGYKKWLGLGGYGAFAISGSGSACGWSYNYKSSKEARQAAVDSCLDNGKECLSIETKFPGGLATQLQSQLKDTGFYGGKIDGVWGRGSQKALEKFAKYMHRSIEEMERENFKLLKLSSMQTREINSTTRSIYRIGRP